MNERLARFFQKAKQDPNYKKKAHQAEISADLRILIAHSGKSFKEVAALAHISPPALSQKLGGDSNLTLDSILAIAQAVGADFDVVFRAENAPRAAQPWEEATTVRNELALARQLLDKSTSIYNEANHHLIEAQAMKATAEAINRRQFMNKNYTKQYAAFEQKPLLQEKRAA